MRNHLWHHLEQNTENQSLNVAFVVVFAVQEHHRLCVVIENTFCIQTVFRGLMYSVCVSVPDTRVSHWSFLQVFVQKDTVFNKKQNRRNTAQWPILFKTDHCALCQNKAGVSVSVLDMYWLCIFKMVCFQYPSILWSLKVIFGY